MAVVTRHRKGGKKVYYVKFWWNEREIWEPAGSDKRAARSLNRQRLQEVREGTYQPKASSDPTVSEWCTSWSKSRNVRSQVDEERALEKAVHQRPWLAGLRLSLLRDAHAFQLVDEVEAMPKEDGSGPISRKYAGNILGVVSHALADAERRGAIIRNPFRAVPRKRILRKSKKRRSIYGAGVIPALVAGPKVHPSSRVFAALAFFLGGREGELCGLTVGDWDRTAAPLTAMRINKQYDGRMLKTDEDEAGEHERIVPVHPVLERVLRGWLYGGGFEMVHGRKPLSGDPIVPARAGGRRKSRMLDTEPGPHHTRSSAYKMWRRACEDAGVTNVSLHSTRHTFTTLACRRSLKETVETITHNARGATIDIYNHDEWDKLCRVVALIDLAEPTAVVTSVVTPAPYQLPAWVEAPGIEPGGADVTIDNDSESDSVEAAAEPPPEPPKQAGSSEYGSNGDADWDARHQSHDRRNNRSLDLVAEAHVRHQSIASGRLKECGCVGGPLEHNLTCRADDDGRLIVHGVKLALSGDESGTLAVIHELAAVAGVAS